MMKKILIAMMLITLTACGDDASDTALKAGQTKSEEGLQGKYQDGALGAGFYYAYRSNEVSLASGLEEAIALVNKKKTLRMDKTHKVSIKEGQMLTVGYYTQPDHNKRYEMFLSGGMLYVDRIIVHFGKETIDSFEMPVGGSAQMSGHLRGSPKVKITYSKKNQVKVELFTE